MALCSQGILIVLALYLWPPPGQRDSIYCVFSSFREPKFLPNTLLKVIVLSPPSLISKSICYSRSPFTRHQRSSSLRSAVYLEHTVAAKFHK